MDTVVARGQSARERRPGLGSHRSGRPAARWKPAAVAVTCRYAGEDRQAGADGFEFAGDAGRRRW